MPINTLNTTPGGEIVIYQPSEGGPRLDVRIEEDTIWLDAHQMAELFERDRTVIVRYIRNVYATGELVPEATCAKNAQVAADGKLRQMDLYNGEARDHQHGRESDQRAELREGSPTIRVYPRSSASHSRANCRNAPGSSHARLRTWIATAPASKQVWASSARVIPPAAMRGRSRLSPATARSA